MISADGTRTPVYLEDDVIHFGSDEHALIAEAIAEQLPPSARDDWPGAFNQPGPDDSRWRARV